MQAGLTELTACHLHPSITSIEVLMREHSFHRRRGKPMNRPSPARRLSTWTRWGFRRANATMEFSFDSRFWFAPEKNGVNIEYQRP